MSKAPGPCTTLWPTDPPTRGAISFHPLLYLLATMLWPDDDECFLDPRRLREQPMHSAQTGSFARLAHIPAQRAPPPVLLQPRQDSHNGLSVRFAQDRGETFRQAADFFSQKEERVWHWTPPCFQRSLHLCAPRWCPCFLSKKCDRSSIILPQKDIPWCGMPPGIRSSRVCGVLLHWSSN